MPKMALQALVLEARRPRDSLNVKCTRACDVWIECSVEPECIMRGQSNRNTNLTTIEHGLI